MTKLYMFSKCVITTPLTATLYDTMGRIDKKRWFNLEYKPACNKLLDEGRISKYNYNKLINPLKHLEDKKYVPKKKQGFSDNGSN